MVKFWAFCFSGATCLRLYRSAYLQILKLFPEDEDSVAAHPTPYT